jgi:hypothetical protein
MEPGLTISGFDGPPGGPIRLRRRTGRLTVSDGALYADGMLVARLMLDTLRWYFFEARTRVSNLLISSREEPRPAPAPPWPPPSLERPRADEAVHRGAGGPSGLARTQHGHWWRIRPRPFSRNIGEMGVLEKR